MSGTDNLNDPDTTVGKAPKLFHCGTLTYTKMALVIVVIGLLWGDFCFVFMETVVRFSVLPLKLKALGGPNWAMGLILTTIPAILNATICPFISFKSDRYRSRWGRRIPFILWSLPFICASLLLMGFSEEIRGFLQTHLPFLGQYAPATVTTVLIGIFMVMYSFFDQFVMSVFWCLFNDVIPPEVVGRVMGLVRLVSTLSGAVFNWFVFQYAQNHMREILIGTAILYLIAFGIVSLVAKEGEYLPIEREATQNKQGLGWIRTFFQECFTNKFYWLVFSAGAFMAIGGAANMFNLFFLRQMQLTDDQIGKAIALGAVVTMPAIYLAAIFVDRWHPIRVNIYAGVFRIVTFATGWVWIFVTLPGTYFFWMFLGMNAINAFLVALDATAAYPLQMRLLPKSRFAQFCSAQAMLKSGCTIGAGVCAGVFIDVLQHFCKDPDFAYRLAFTWNLVFVTASAITMLFVYRHWQRLGGFTHFHPPAPWSSTGMEEAPIVPSVGPQSRWLRLALRLFDVIMAVSVLGLPVMMGWMHARGAAVAFKWFGQALLPLSVLTWLLWEYVKRGIYRDMRRARGNESLRNGIPHHGILMCVAIQFLLMCGLWMVQVVITISLKMEIAALVFGLANVITNVMLVGAIYLMCRVERGCSTVIDISVNNSLG